MTPPPATTPPDGSGPSLIRSAIWVAIGAVIAAAVVSVVWVLVGPQNGIIGRAFLTILLLAGFAGAAIFDARVAPTRPAWYSLASMVGWVLALLTGAFKIWVPFDDFAWEDNPFVRFLEFLAIVLIIRLALLHIRLFLKAHARHVTVFTRIIAVVTVVLVVALALMLVVPLTFPRAVDWPELYWRFVVAVTILAAVGTALIPLINALVVPRPPRQPTPGPPPVYPQWPTYVDGVTPLPVLPDGTPDWNAYYTGYPSVNMQAIAPVATMPVPGPNVPAPQTPGEASAPGVPAAPRVAPAAPPVAPYTGTTPPAPPPPPLPTP